MSHYLKSIFRIGKKWFSSYRVRHQPPNDGKYESELDFMIRSASSSLAKESLTRPSKTSSNKKAGLKCL